MDVQIVCIVRRESERGYGEVLGSLLFYLVDVKNYVCFFYVLFYYVVREGVIFYVLVNIFLDFKFCRFCFCQESCFDKWIQGFIFVFEFLEMLMVCIICYVLGYV